MKAPRSPRRLTLSIGQRLLLGLAPALLAVILVLELAYYGELGRRAPAYVISGAAVLAVISLVVTWLNTRYLAMRIQRLARGMTPAVGSIDEAADDDELGRIAQVVAQLGAALTESESQRRESHAVAETRMHEQATILGATVRDALVRLDEVRLPLHILQDAPFGELNENQEEMISAARTAADAMDAVLRRLMVCSDVDRDAFTVLMERCSVNDVIRGVLPMLRASAERDGVRLQVDLDPALPKAMVDRTRLAEAIALFGVESTQAAVKGGGTIRVASGKRDDALWVSFAPIDMPDDTAELQRMLATRLVSAQGGSVLVVPDGIEIRLPRHQAIRP